MHVKKGLGKNKRLLVFAGILSILVFAFILTFLNSFFVLDYGIKSFFDSIQNNFVVRIMSIISFSASWQVISVVLVVICGFCLIKRKSWELMFFVVNGAFLLFVEFILKNLVHRIRPTDFLNDFSFPSNHVLAAILFYWSLAYLLKDKWKHFSLFLFVLPFFVAFSRLYLGAHWFSDVFASFFLGVFWLCFSFLIFFGGFSKKKK